MGPRPERHGAPRRGLPEEPAPVGSGHVALPVLGSVFLPGNAANSLAPGPARVGRLTPIPLAPAGALQSWPDCLKRGVRLAPAGTPLLCPSQHTRREGEALWAWPPEGPPHWVTVLPAGPLSSPPAQELGYQLVACPFPWGRHTTGPPTGLSRHRRPETWGGGPGREGGPAQLCQEGTVPKKW